VTPDVLALYGLDAAHAAWACAWAVFANRIMYPLVRARRTGDDGCDASGEFYCQVALQPAAVLACTILSAWAFSYAASTPAMGSIFAGGFGGFLAHAKHTTARGLRERRATVEDREEDREAQSS